MSGEEIYPKWMSHPHEVPAILSDDYEAGDKPRMGYSAQVGRARMLPPVQVMDRHQEAYYAAQGYRVGPSSKPAFVPRPMPAPPAAAPDNGIRLIDGREFPRWAHGPAGSAIVRSPEEEAAWLAQVPTMTGPAPPELVTKETLVKTQSNLPPPKPAKALNAGMHRRWDLVRQAKWLGIPADRTWKIPDLERAIAEHDHENAEENACLDGEEVRAWQAGDGVQGQADHGEAEEEVS